MKLYFWAGKSKEKGVLSLNNSSPIITLSSDQGWTDHYLATVKGCILQELDQVRIIDVSHNIEPFNLYQAAYVLGHAYKSFPIGSIHIIGIDSTLSLEQDHLAVKIEGHYFICADNGILSLIFPDIRPEKMVSLNIAKDEDAPTFPMKDIFVRAACHIARGGTLEVIGSRAQEWKEVKPLKPVVASDNKSILGSVVHIDHFGNIITNIDQKLFQKVRATRDFEINLARGKKIKKIATHYAQTQQHGNLIALFNSEHFLEIALYRGVPQVSGTAQSLLGIKYRDQVQVTFSS